MRPELNSKIKPEVFTNYYWVKEELFFFCKQNNIPAAGNKTDLTDRIYEYLKTGEIGPSDLTVRLKKTTDKVYLSLDAIIPDGYSNDERHRAFFKSQIGEHFKFNVPFMNWMKNNSGKTYLDAVTEWNRIINEKKQGKKTEISPQFQYNQYVRDFFEANPEGKRDDAIKCWKHKKSLPGHNKYEDGDLTALPL